MSAGDVLQTALMNLWRRKLRAVLTVLGMVIGTASIVVMVSLGIGIKQATLESFSEMGSLTNITVNAYRFVESESGRYGSVVEQKLDKRSVDKIRALPGVKAVMPQIVLNGTLKSGKWISDVTILGVEADIAAEFGITLEDGRYPSYKRGSNSYELVMSGAVLYWFYDADTYKQAMDKDGNPRVSIDDRFQLTFDRSNFSRDMGQDASVAPGGVYRLDVVGKVSENSNEFSWYCLMDMEAIKKLARENSAFVTLNTTNYETVMVKCASTDDVRSVKAAIDEMGFGTNSLQDALETAEKSMRQIQYLLGAIGGVSLLVAAIGIMNTMMMSIYERTREIGIMKVLGCRMRDIASLFLAEAAYIGFFGGLAGLGISYGLSAAINMFVQDSGLKSVIPPYLALFALLFSTIVAMVSGLYPALRAMKLSPLAALGRA